MFRSQEISLVAFSCALFGAACESGEHQGSKLSCRGAVDQIPDVLVLGDMDETLKQLRSRCGPYTTLISEKCDNENTMISFDDGLRQTTWYFRNQTLEGLVIAHDSPVNGC